MSARAPVGASNRADLFSSRTGAVESKDPESKANEPSSPNAKQKQLQEAYGMSDGSNDPLQLEHMLGFAGDYRRTILALNGDENRYVKSMGSLVSIENLNDSQDQRILRGHDMQVCSLAISPSGKIIASGQIGTKHFKGNAAPVFLWSSSSGRRLMVLRGLTTKVNLLAFSTDERLLCGCGEDSLLYVWDTATGEVMHGQRLKEGPASVLLWIDHRTENRRTVYEVAVGAGSTMLRGFFSYEQARVQWVMKWEPYSMPPGGGMVRYFTSIDKSPNRMFIYVGTTGGDVLVFRRDAGVFRACIPVCTNGVRSVVTMPDGDIILAGGDGTLKRLTGGDMSWAVLHESCVEAPIIAMTLSDNQSELIIGCSSGAVLRCMASDLQGLVTSVSHISPITCLTFSKTVLTICASGTITGEVRVWDIIDYACLAVMKAPTRDMGAVLCLCMTIDGCVVTGWQDGSVRCFDGTLSRQLWFIPGAHRGGCNSMTVHTDGPLSFLVTGGGDGSVRVWRLGNRELVIQYTEHTRPVAKVLIDVAKSSIVHSVGSDCSVLSYDIKANRRIICHIVNSGAMLDMTQRRDQELELITCDSQGRV